MMKAKEQGYTLIELLGVILIIAILSGLATYSSRVLFDGNVRSYASQFATAVRNVKSKTVASSRDNWSIEINKLDDRYYWQVFKDGREVEYVKLPKDVEIMKVIELENGSISKQDVSGQSISFISNTGKVNQDVAGEYQFVSKVTDRVVRVTIVQNTGGILIDD